MFCNIDENVAHMEREYKDCSDFLLRRCTAGGRAFAVCVLDGMIDSLQLSQMIMEPLLTYDFESSGALEMYREIRERAVRSLEMSETKDFEDIYFYLSSGFAALFEDGVDSCLVFGIQGFQKRPTGEPENESDIKGAKECFTETLNDNKAALHRRIKSPRLKMKQLKLGQGLKNSVAVCYLEGAADMRLVADVERRLLSSGADGLSGEGQIAEALDSDIASLFSAVGDTERPDTLCSKLAEGRVAVLTDGSPHAVYVPYLFTDSFSTVDDYNNRPFYATFNRLLKYFSFVISVILPGFYVAVGTYHQELLPSSLMYTVAAAEASTPFSLMQEAVMVLVLYEIMREAGLRLPKTIGHAVSIIGALVIGDAVVNAGLVGAPMLVVVALTAIASYVVYPLYESISVLRIIFILLGGFTGIYGVVLGASALCVNITALSPYGVPYSSPIAPLSKNSSGDMFARAPWRRLLKHRFNIKELRGADCVNDALPRK